MTVSLHRISLSFFTSAIIFYFGRKKQTFHHVNEEQAMAEQLKGQCLAANRQARIALTSQFITRDI